MYILQMKKITLFLSMLTICSALCFTQNDNQITADNNSPDGTILFQPTRKGDKFMKIGLSLNIPLFHTGYKNVITKTNIYPGGAIKVGFAYYVLNAFALGGTLGFQFAPTLAKNIYFSVPVTFDMSYTFAAGKWRFPLGLGIGASFQSYNGNGAKYFGMLFRPDFGVYYQYSPEWSFGGDISWEIVPQWYKNKSHNLTGNFLDFSFFARYYF